MVIRSNSSQLMPFNLQANLVEGRVIMDKKTFDSHIHNQCEIYVNLTGNVSFMVENRVYSIRSGDAIITRPYEAHHCIYHETTVHDHFCISFSYEGNEEILSTFFGRKPGEDNLISLSKPHKERLIKLCYALVEEQSDLKRYAAFFGLLDLLTEERPESAVPYLPQDVRLCMEYINSNPSTAWTVKKLAELSHVTVNTLERHFKANIGLSPYTYIQNCRLALAVSILESGGTVTQAAVDSGFPDYSHFIALFKKRYGKTPLQFKKEL